MSIFSKLFGRNNAKAQVDGVEDFSALIRVYFQATIATTLGINNPRFMPDVINFKRTFKVATEKNKLGVAEGKACKKMLMKDYNLSDNFFKEIRNSVKKNCRTQNDVNSYLFMYQGFSNDLMMLIGKLMQWKMRIPSMFNKVLRGVTESTVHDLCTKDYWKADDTHKTAQAFRNMRARLNFSESWISEYAFNIIVLAKKDAKHNKKANKK